MITLKVFQIQAKNKIVSMLRNGTKEDIVMQAPTGAGKTIILSYAISDYFRTSHKKTCFWWFSIGAGELEEQSKSKFERLVPNYETLTLDEAIRNGFGENQVVFVNWEMLDKSSNKALRDQESKNLKDRIRECQDNGVEVIIIRDEVHMHNTKKADDILNLFGITKKVSASATIDKKTMPVLDIEITEDDVIRSGLITKMISINEGLSQLPLIGGYEEYPLMDLAIAKQIEIAAAYKKIDLGLNPLVIVQFPNESKNSHGYATNQMQRVEDYLRQKGYSYENGLVACWLDGDKKNIDSKNQPLDDVTFLFAKQALSVGWDCPRAKILVKLRTNMSDSFEIQTIGRIRRMPEQRHYGEDLLDNCYLYTFDDKYKEQVIKEFGGKEARVLYLKKDYMNLDLPLYRQTRPNTDIMGTDDKQSSKKVVAYFIDKYELEDIQMTAKDVSGYARNKQKLETVGENGYDFSDQIILTTSEGNISHLSDMTKKMSMIMVKQDPPTDILDRKYKNAIWIIAEKLGMKDNVIRTITQRLFLRERMNKKQKKITIGRVCNLSKRQFKIFVVNNKDQIAADIRDAIYHMDTQMQLTIKPSSFKFSIPRKDIVYLDPDATDQSLIPINVYDEYTRDILRSRPERRFENECIKSGKVKWFYKNGDYGQNYFSVVYTDGISKPYLFYPDYILMTTDDRLFIIEIKGGEDAAGKSRNIDKDKAPLKFKALKSYVEDHNKKNPAEEISFAFVRDVDEEDQFGNRTYKLFFDDTEWTEDMGSEWKPISQLF